MRDALAGGVGIDQRESETDGVEYLYVAVPCTYQGELAVVRVSRTMERVNELMSNYLWVSVGLVVAALVVALITAWLVSRRAVAPLMAKASLAPCTIPGPNLPPVYGYGR